jgi:hypothetical protein
MLRSVGAILAGFVSIMVVVMIGTAIATAALVPGGIRAAMSATPGPLPVSYLAVNLLVSFLAAAAGGALAARLAPASSWMHVTVLAALLLLMAVPPALRGGSPGQPAWYPWVIGLLGVSGVLLGGAIAGRRTM